LIILFFFKMLSETYGTIIIIIILGLYELLETIRSGACIYLIIYFFVHCFSDLPKWWIKIHIYKYKTCIWNIVIELYQYSKWRDCVCVLESNLTISIGLDSMPTINWDNAKLDGSPESSLPIRLTILVGMRR